MTSKTHRRKKRILSSLALGFAVAAISAPAALADGRSPDTLDAAFAAQSSIVDGRSPDTIDAASAAQSSILDGRSADTIDAAQGLNSHSVDPLAVSYLLGQGLSPSQVASWTTGACSRETKAQSCYAMLDRGGSNSVDPLAVSYLLGQGLSRNEIESWTVGACSHRVKGSGCYAMLNGSRFSSSIVDGRSPDTRDASYAAHEPVVVVHSTSFDWGDAGIGFGAAFGLGLVGIGGALMIRRRENGEVVPA